MAKAFLLTGTQFSQGMSGPYVTFAVQVLLGPSQWLPSSQLSCSWRILRAASGTFGERGARA